MTSETRAYRKRRRAEGEAETRLRITESAVHLHGTVGPARTSMSAVAEHAGVQRSTLYRHFPDERALFAACSAHWRADHPLPDLASWAAIDDPAARLESALGQLYAYYERGAPMIANLIRDETVIEAVAERFGQFRAFLGAAADVLVAGRRVRGAAARRTRAAVGHALAFTTWQSLAQDQGLSRTDAVRLACGLVEAAAAYPRRPWTSGTSPH